MRASAILLLLGSLLLWAGEAFADKRVALVIGNSSYRNAPKLTNPASDAAAIALFFKNAGFEVVQSRNDLGVDDMRRAVRDFTDSTYDADMAVVFYAGHGIEVDGMNYLVPVDASLKRDIDVEDETVSLERVLKVLEPAKKLRLVILDACRDNPFTRDMKRTIATRSVGRGLARVEPAVSDTVVAFAAKAGSTAADGDSIHSPFTLALLKNLAVPGLDLRIAFGRVRDEVLKSTNRKQEPFVYSSLGGATVSLLSSDANALSSSSASSDAVNPAAHAYELAAQVGTPEGWDSFLVTYPTGFYGDLARAQRAKLGQFKSAALTPGEAAAPSGITKPKDAISPPSRKPKVDEKKSRGGLLQECLAGYVRRKGAFVPEGQSTGDVKSRSDMTSMCNFAIAHRNYYWRRIQ